MNIIKRAFDYLADGRPQEAFDIYSRVLAFAPDHPNILYYLSVTYNRLDDIATAIGWLRRACRVNPSDPDNYSNLGRSCLFTGRFEEAEPALRNRLAYVPDDMEALKNLGSLLLFCGRTDEAVRIHRRLLAENPGETIELRLRRSEVHGQIARNARQTDLPRGLVVRGAFREGSGYGHAVRQFVRRFVDAGVPVQLIDRLTTPDSYMRRDQYDPFFDALDRPVRASAVLNFTTPIEVECIPGLQTLNYTFFEAAQIPDLWMRHSRRHDHVFVATESCRAAWLAAGHPPERISVCPLGVSPVDRRRIPTLALPENSGRMYLGRRLRFVNISEVVPRKNLPALMRVWLRATRPDDDCALMVKAGTAAGSPRLFQEVLAEAVAATGVSLAEAAPVFGLSGRYTDDEMLSLLASGTHYWSMSHGEGWDLPMTQAGALGLTLIAPRHSAYMDYLTPDTAHLLPCAVTPGLGSYNRLPWWSPDEDAAAQRLRQLIDAPDGGQRSAAEQLQRGFDWDLSARRLLDELTRVGALG